MKEKQIKVQSVQFSPLSGEGGSAFDEGKINMLLDIPIEVSVELGRTQLRIKEILHLGPGSIIEVNKLAGEPVDVLVNQNFIAKGEVLVLDEKFGIRITDIISQREREQKLK